MRLVQMVKEFFRVLRSNENFFKHADRDPAASVTFNPESTASLLFEAVAAHAMLAGSGRHRTPRALDGDREPRRPGLVDAGAGALPRVVDRRVRREIGMAAA